MRALLAIGRDTEGVVLQRAMVSGGVDAVLVSSAEEALSHADPESIDAAVIDGALGSVPGETVLDGFRRIKPSPGVIMMLPSRDVRRRVAALHAGADDVVDPAVDARELVARFYTVVRRCRGFHLPVLDYGCIKLSIESRQVWVNGVSVSLTLREFLIVEFLASRRGAVVSKERILDRLYFCSDEVPDLRVIDAFVAKIRRKFAALGSSNIIRTFWGEGYSLVGESNQCSSAVQSSVSPSTPFSPSVLRV